MTISNLQISYPDFKVNDIINPDEFDINNNQIVTKVNTIIALLNQLTDANGAELVNAVPISGVAGANVKEQIANLKQQLNEVVAAGIADGSVTMSKLGQDVVDKLKTNTYTGDLNSLIVDGSYYAWDAQNKPASDMNGFNIRVAKFDDSHVFQMAQHLQSNRVWVRRKDTGVWKPWTLVSNETIILPMRTNLDTLREDGTFFVYDAQGAPFTGFSAYVSVKKAQDGYVEQVVSDWGAQMMFRRRSIDSNWGGWVRLDNHAWWVTSVNSITVSGNYYVAGAGTGTPNDYSGYLEHIQHPEQSNYATQIFRDYARNFVYERRCNAGVWTAWERTDTRKIYEGLFQYSSGTIHLSGYNLTVMAEDLGRIGGVGSRPFGGYGVDKAGSLTAKEIDFVGNLTITFQPGYTGVRHSWRVAYSVNGGAEVDLINKSQDFYSTNQVKDIVPVNIIGAKTLTLKYYVTSGGHNDADNGWFFSASLDNFTGHKIYI